MCVYVYTCISDSPPTQCLASCLSRRPSSSSHRSKDELVGKSVTLLMDEVEADAHASFVSRYEMTGEKRIMGKPRGACPARRHPPLAPLW